MTMLGRAAPVVALAAALAACAGDLAPVVSAEANRPTAAEDPTVAAPGRARVPAEVFFVPEVPPKLDPVPPSPPLEAVVDEIGEEFLPPIPLPEGEPWDGGEARDVVFTPEEAVEEVEVGADFPSPAEPQPRIVEIHTYEVEEVPVETVVWATTPVYFIQGLPSPHCGRPPAAPVAPCPAPVPAPCDPEPAVVVVEPDPPAPPPVAAPRPRRTTPRWEDPPAARPPREERLAREDRLPRVHLPELTRRAPEPAAPIQRPTLESYAGVRTFEPPSPPAADPPDEPRPRRNRSDDAREDRREERRETRQERREERREPREERRAEPRREPERAAPIRQPDPPAPPPPPQEHHRRRGKD